MLYERRFGRTVPERQIAGREDRRRTGRICTSSGTCPTRPASLKAVAKRNGKIVAIDEVYTAGKPAKLVLTADRKQIARPTAKISPLSKFAWWTRPDIFVPTPTIW